MTRTSRATSSVLTPSSRTSTAGCKPYGSGATPCEKLVSSIRVGLHQADIGLARVIDGDQN